MFRILSSVVVMGTLAACGGGSGGGGVTIDRAYVDRKVNAFEAASNRFEDIKPTAFKAMPTSGSASFSGAGGFFIENNPNRDADDISIVGDADITANFSRGTVTGDVTNLFGVVGDDPKKGRFFDVDGEIEIGGRGSSIGRGDPNDFATTYDGRLTTERDGNYVLRGTADGKFAGTRAAQSGTPDAIRAIAGFDENAGITRNGKKIESEFVLFGEN